MNVLVVNCGSSSLSFKVYRVLADGTSSTVLAGKARNVATSTQAQPVLEWVRDGAKSQRICELSSHQSAAQQMLSLLAEESISIDAVGHRFVHGGEVFKTTTRVDE